MKIKGNKPGGLTPSSKVHRQGPGVKGKKVGTEDKLVAADSVDLSR